MSDRDQEIIGDNANQTERLEAEAPATLEQEEIREAEHEREEVSHTIEDDEQANLADEFYDGVSDWIGGTIRPALQEATKDIEIDPELAEGAMTVGALYGVGAIAA